MNFRALFVGLLIAFGTQAAGVNDAKISTTAGNYLAKLQAVESVSASSRWSIRKILPLQDQAMEIGYCVELAPQGYMILTNDEDFPPVIAYSLHHNWSNDDNPQNTLYHMTLEHLKILQLNKAILPHKKLLANRAAWQRLQDTHSATLSASSFQQWPAPGFSSTGGWVDTQWDQHSPYNKYCPIDPSTSLRSVVGCVPVSVAQVVNYYKRPIIKALSPLNNYISHENLHLDQDSTKYQFPSFNALNRMLQEISRKYSNSMPLNEDDIAALLFSSGIALQTQYSQSASGTDPSMILSALHDFFDLKSAMYTAFDNEGIAYNRLKENMFNGTPAIGVALRYWEGHAIVIDGFNTDQFFHLNFGWGPNADDGWYLIPDQLPAGFQLLTELWLDIKPLSSEGEGIQFSQSEIAFPACRLGSTGKPARLTVQNTTYAPIQLQSIKCTPSYQFKYGNSSISDSIGPLQINAGGKIELEVYFLPEHQGHILGHVMIALENGRYRAAGLSGVGIPVDGGTIIENDPISEVWPRTGSPYYICRDLDLAERNLLIEAGCEIILMGKFRVFVTGFFSRLIARGNEVDSIRFRPYDESINWKGIRFAASRDDDSLCYCSLSGVEGSCLEINSSSPVITHSTIFNNLGSLGSALRIESASPRIEHSLICGNNGVSYRGAPIYMREANVLFKNCAIAHNVCVGAGGALLSEGSDLTLLNSVVYGNRALWRGGALYLSRANQINIKNSILWDNKDREKGAAIYFEKQLPGWETDKLFITYSDIDTGQTGGWIEHSASGAELVSLGIGTRSQEPRFVAPHLNDFRLLEDSPCIDAGDPADPVGLEPAPNGFCINLGNYGGTALAATTQKPTLTLNPGLIEFKEVKPKFPVTAELMVSNGSASDLVIDSVQFTDSVYFSLYDELNQKISTSGAIVLRAGESRKWKLQFYTLSTTRPAYSTTVTFAYDNSRSAVIQVTATMDIGVKINKKVVNGKWYKSKSPYYIYNDIQVMGNDQLEIEPGVRVIFTGPYKISVGEFAKLLATGTAQDSIYFAAEDSLTGWKGIELMTSGSDDVFAYCSFRYSRTTGSMATPTRRGALSIIKSSPKIRRCSFSHCSTDWYGGAIYFEDPTYRTYTLYLDSCRFVNNLAGQHGGAIFCSGNARLKGCTFSGNSAAIVGGTLALWGGYSCSLYDCSIQSAAGGTITADGSLLLDHCLIKKGPAGPDGGIQLAGAGVILENATIYGTRFSSSGGTSNTVRVNNSILWREKADSAPLFNSPIGSNTNYEFFYSDIDTGAIGAAGYGKDGYFWQAGTIHQDPLFTDAGAGDFTLQSGSPCIDAGDPLSPYVANEPLPNGFRLNMGYLGGTSKAEITSRAALEIFPDSLEFKDIITGTPQIKKLTLKNGSPYAIHLQRFAFSDTANFALLDRNGSLLPVNHQRTILPGRIDTLGIRFTLLDSAGLSTKAFMVLESEEQEPQYIPLMLPVQYGTDVAEATVFGRWLKQNSPYNVLTYITVPEGQSLRIEPGVTVRFMGEYQLTVRGSLLAVGSADDSIRFVANDAQRGWKGIHLSGRADQSSTIPDSIVYCRISHSHDSGLDISNKSALVSNCLFEKNEGIEGGAICLSYATAKIVESTIKNNHATVGGGAICATRSSCELANSLIIRNSSSNGGVFCCWEGGITLANTVVAYNSAADIGAISSIGEGSLTFKNCTLHQNLVMNGSNRCTFHTSRKSATVSLLNTILTDFHYLNGNSKDNPLDSVIVSHVVIDTSGKGLDWLNKYGKAPLRFVGGPIVSADPRYIDPEKLDFRLTADSPCIDAGDPDPSCNDPEDPAATGFALEPARGTIRCDIGAFGGNGARHLSDVDSQKQEETLPASFRILPNYPNPFNDRTCIEFALAQPSRCVIEILNLRGAHVKTLVSGQMTAGLHKTFWDGRDEYGLNSATGIYFCTISADRWRGFHKLLLLR
jgi:predicted outer membrane repeat protein